MIKDYSLKFERTKQYVITAMQVSSTPEEGEMRFSNQPVKPVYISGNQLIRSKIKTADDYVLSPVCQHKPGTPVHFFEVSHDDANVRQVKHVYTATSNPQPVETQQVTLNDGTVQEVTRGHASFPNIIMPPSGDSKAYIAALQENIKELQGLLSKERDKYSSDLSMITAQYNDLLKEKSDLALEKMQVEAERDAYKLRYEERVAAYNDMNSAADEQPTLADKIDAMAGEGTSEVVMQGLAEGVGKAIPKILDFAINFANNKLKLPQPQPQPVVMQQITTPQSPPSQGGEDMRSMAGVVNEQQTNNEMKELDEWLK